MARPGFQPGNSRLQVGNLTTSASSEPDESSSSYPFKGLVNGVVYDIIQIVSPCPSTRYEYMKGHGDSPLRPEVTDGNQVLLNLVLCIFLPLLSLLSSYFPLCLLFHSILPVPAFIPLQSPEPQNRAFSF